MIDQDIILKVTSFGAGTGEEFRPRSVSFHLPEDHDEQKEKEMDARVHNCRLQTNGQCSVSCEDVLITKKNGTKVLITETKATYLPSTDEKPSPQKEKPARHFCFLKVFATVGVVMFPPLGIPALIFAFKAHRIDKCASKYTNSTEQCTQAAKVSERLIVTSLVFGLLMWCILTITIDIYLKSKIRDAGTGSGPR